MTESEDRTPYHSLRRWNKESDRFALTPSSPYRWKTCKTSRTQRRSTSYKEWGRDCSARATTINSKSRSSSNSLMITSIGSEPCKLSPTKPAMLSNSTKKSCRTSRLSRKGSLYFHRLCATSKLVSWPSNSHRYIRNLKTRWLKKRATVNSRTKKWS